MQNGRSELPSSGADAGELPGQRALPRSLEIQLGPFGYQWLCSCAAYPYLRFALSLHLGRVLARELGREEPSEDECLALFALPWFRNGWMPLVLRRMLLADLLPRLEEPVRREIACAQYSADVFGRSSAKRGPVPLLALPPGWDKVDAAVNEGAIAAPGEDALFVRFMSSVEENGRRARARSSSFVAIVRRHRWTLAVLSLLWIVTTCALVA